MNKHNLSRDEIADAMAAAAAAAAIQVSRPGTGAAIPARSEADRFLRQSV